MSSSDDRNAAEDGAAAQTERVPEDPTAMCGQLPADLESDVPGGEQASTGDPQGGAPSDAVAATSTEGEAPRKERRRGKLRVLAAVVLAAAAFTATIVALANRSTVAPGRADIILAIDVSLSLQATDVPPSRLEVTKAAAARFTSLVPSKVKIGLVSFAGTAEFVVAPTTDRALLKGWISDLHARQRTAVGEAVFTALQGAPSAGRRIVLVSDGATTTGRSEDDAARAAAAGGVPVFTIALGTATATVTVQGQEIPVPVEKEALRRLAQATRGRFYEAASAEDISRAYVDILHQVAYRDARVGVTTLTLAISTVVAAAVGGLVWFLARHGSARPARASPEPQE